MVFFIGMMTTNVDTEFLEGSTRPVLSSPNLPKAIKNASKTLTNTARLFRELLPMKSDDIKSECDEIYVHDTWADRVRIRTQCNTIFERMLKDYLPAQKFNVHFKGRAQLEQTLFMFEDRVINEHQMWLIINNLQRYPNVHPKQILKIIEKRKKNQKDKQKKRDGTKRERETERAINRDKKRSFILDYLETEMPCRVDGEPVSEEDPTYRSIINGLLEQAASANNWLDQLAHDYSNPLADVMTSQRKWFHYCITIAIYSLSGGFTKEGLFAISSIVLQAEGASPWTCHLLQGIAGLASQLHKQSRKTKKGKKNKNTVLETEGRIADAMTALKDNTVYFFSTEIVSDMLTMISHLAAHKLFTKETSEYIFAYLKPKPVERMTKPGLFVMVWQHVTQLVAIAESMWAGASLYEAIEQFSKLEGLEVLENKIVTAFPNAYPGIPPEGCYSEQYVYTLACDYISRAEARLVSTGTKDKNYIKYNTSLEIVKGIRAQLEIILKGRIRYTPFGCILFGESQIGKSYFIKYLQKEFLEVFGIEYDAKMVYNRDYNQEYWERYFGHPIVFYSELGTTAPSIAARQGDPGMLEFCSLIDNNEKQLTMAFQGKGCTPFRSLGVFGDGNNFNPESEMETHLNVELTVSNPGAVMNRFIFPTMKVKKEYCLEDSKTLDTDKAKLNPDRWFDIYDFEIWESKREGFKKVSFKKTFNGNIDDFTVVYKNKILKHFMNQKMAQENVQRALYDERYGFTNVKMDPVQKIVKVIRGVFAHVYKHTPVTDFDVQDEEKGMDLDDKGKLKLWLENNKLLSDPNYLDLLRRAVITHLSKDPDEEVRELVSYIKDEDFSSIYSSGGTHVVAQRSDEIEPPGTLEQQVRTSRCVTAPLAWADPFDPFYEDHGEDSEVDSEANTESKSDHHEQSDTELELTPIPFTFDELKRRRASFFAREELKSLQYFDKYNVPSISWQVPGYADKTILIPKDREAATDVLNSAILDMTIYADNLEWEPDNEELWKGAVACNDLSNAIQDYLRILHETEMPEYSNPYSEMLCKRLNKMKPILSSAKNSVNRRVNGIFSSCGSWFRMQQNNVYEYVTALPTLETSFFQLACIWLVGSKVVMPFALAFQVYSVWYYLLGLFPFVMLFFMPITWMSFFLWSVVWCCEICWFIVHNHDKVKKDMCGFATHLELRRRIYVAEQLMRSKLGCEITKVVVKPLFFAVSAITITSACAWYLSHLLKKTPQSESDEEKFVIVPILKEEGAYMSAIQEIEEKTECDIPYPRVRNKRVMDQWISVQTAISGGAKCANIAQFNNRIANNLRRMLIEGVSAVSGDEIVIDDCIGFGFTNFFIFPKHYLKAISSGSVYVFSPDGKSGKTKIIDVGKTKICDLHTDLCAVKVYTFSFGDCSNDFPDGHIPYFKGRIKGKEVVCELTNGITVKDANTKDLIEYKDVYLYKCQTYKGLCGELLLTNIGDRHFIAGMHVAGNANTLGAAVPLTLDMVKKVENYFATDILVPLAQVPISAPVDETHLFVTQLGYEPVAILIEPHPRSCVNYEELNYLRYHGRIPNSVPVISKSKVTTTGLDHDKVTEIFNVHGLYPEKEFVPPLMKSTKIGDKWINPINVNIKDMDRPDVLLDPSVCNAVVEEIVNVYLERIRGRKSNDFHLKPLTMRCAINGMDHDKILRKVDLSKAGGFNYPGKKSKYFVEFEGDNYPCDQLESDVAKILRLYSAGKSCPQIFKGTLKDEPRSMKKRDLGQTRMFFASSLPHLIVQRMFLAPIMTLKMELDGIFNSAIGIDAHREINEFLARFADKVGVSVPELMQVFKALELDYRGFDKETCTMITSSAFTIVFEIGKRLGYNHTACIVLRSLLADAIVSYFCVDGDIFSRPGIFGSGQYATAELNDFRNTFMIVYALHFLVYPFVTVHYRRFDKILEHNTYGDDLLGAVFKPFQHLFNNITYTQFCKKYYGVVCTPANKDKEMSNFIPFSESSFLKRTFRVKEDLDGRFVGLLDCSSIRKTLLWYIPGQVPSLLQWRQMVESCMRELFFHLDRKNYESFGMMLMEHIRDVHAVEDNWIPAYDKIRESLIDNMETQMSVKILPGRLEYNNLEVPQGESARYSHWLPPYFGIPTHICEGFDYIETKCGTATLGVNSALLSVPLDNNRIAATVRKDDIGDFKSGVITPDTIDVHQNVTDVSATPTVQNIAPAPTDIRLYDAVDVGLSEFLNRPIQIASYAIAHATDSSTILNPWDLYLAEPSVRAKLKNYGFMRAKLKTKVVISGTPFHQGSLLVAKILYPGQVDTVVAYAGGSAFATRAMFLKYLTQTQGRGIMNLHDNIPFEMEFPFVNPQPIGRLFDSSSTAALPSATNYPDFTNMAKLYLYTLNQQVDTSGSATDVYVYVYAWLEDVILGCPTASPYVLTTEMPDERVVGPVEKFTSAAAKYSRYFMEIPFIAPFAKASEIAFSAISSVSAIFGWSVPTVIEKPQRMKNEPFQNACQVIGYDTGHRLTLDPKQEVTVDPKVLGVSHDELAIRHLSKIESLLDQFAWSTSASSMTPLWKTMVTPNARTPIVGAATRKIQPTVLDYITLPFRFWRGRIKFKIQVICTQFHRGKFAIIYEPDITKDALVVANLKLNKQYMKIIDISETQEVEFCIDWATNKMWAPVLAVASDQTTGSTITTSQLPAYSAYVNGMVYIVPITKLQAPNATSAQFNVFISCDDLRVCYPDAAALPKTMLLTEMPATEVLDEKSDPTLTPTSCMVLNPVGGNDSNISHLVFGEEVHSFRALLKKFFYSASTSNAISSPPTVHQVIFPVVPSTTPTPTTDNTTISNLFAHLRLCFLGMRGGLRKRVEFFGVQNSTNDSVRIALSAPGASTTSAGVTVVANDTSPNSLTGTVWFIPSTNAGMETEIPYYCNNLFHFANNNNTPIASAIPNVEVLANRNYVVTHSASNAATTAAYREWTAMAEDFTFGYFVGVPYYRSL